MKDFSRKCINVICLFCWMTSNSPALDHIKIEIGFLIRVVS